MTFDEWRAGSRSITDKIARDVYASQIILEFQPVTVYLLEEVDLWTELDRISAIMEWKHANSRGKMRVNGSLRSIFFENDEDAALFKLRYQDEFDLEC